MVKISKKLVYHSVRIQIRPNILLGLIWVQTVCKGHQQRQRFIANISNTLTHIPLQIHVVYVQAQMLNCGSRQLILLSLVVVGVELSPFFISDS